MTETVWQRLAAPFDPSEIEWKETGSFTAPYPRADAIMNRLDAVCGPAGWEYDLAVINADPRPVYLCELRVRDPEDPQRWVCRAATSGEPHMSAKGGAMDFLNAGKGGGTYAFRKAFQDGFCRYLSDQSQWPARNGQAQGSAFDEVPLHTGRGAHVPAGAPAPAGGTDFKGFQPSNPDNPPCPICKGKMWDNREPERGGKGKFAKKTPQAPDFKCQTKTCDGAWWPARGHKPKPAGVPEDAQPAPDEVPW